MPVAECVDGAWYMRVQEAVVRLRANDTVLTQLHLDGEHVWARCRGAVLRGRTVRTYGG